MPIRLHSDFLADLVSVGDANLAGRVLRKIFDQKGRFIDVAKEDHRYDGIPDAWIRKVSKGMRIIYIRNGEDILVYRAGEHSIEDHLKSPTSLKDGPAIESQLAAAMRNGPGLDIRSYTQQRLDSRKSIEQEFGSATELSPLLYNHTDRFLYSNLIGRRYLPHKDVYLVSPYVSFNLLRSTDLFGQMLDELIEDGTSVWLVTNPPKSSPELEAFEGLSSRKINVFFNESLHAKVFAFLLNRELLKPGQLAYRDFVSLGSANLTDSGLNPRGLLSDNLQYELSYETGAKEWPDMESFILRVTDMSIELDVFRANLSGEVGG